MATLPADVTATLATLEARWGAAAPRRAVDDRTASETVGEVVGALATVPLPLEPERHAAPAPAEGVVSTGFPALDAIIGPGGVPRTTSVALRGTGSSGKTTLALRLAAEAQVAGSIVAWLDAARAFDPVEAVARGVRLPWLVVVTPADLEEGLAIAGTLLGGRSVDLLVIDLPARLPPGTKTGRIADRLHRLTALARRSGTLLVLLEPPGGSGPLGTAVAESAGLRLELERRAWIRLGRDVVGQRTEAVIARNRFGPPGRRADLRILYADGDERDACLAADGLLVETPVHDAPIPVPGKVRDATAPPAMATSPPGSRPSPLRLVPDAGSGDPDRPRGPALDGRDGPRRQPASPGARRSAGDAARERAPARA
jgi:recombination protein RecA